MSFSHSELSSPIEAILEETQLCLSTLSTTENDALLPLLGSFDEILSNPDNIAYLQSRPDLLKKTHQLNLDLIEVLTHTFSAATQSAYAHFRVDDIAKTSLLEATSDLTMMFNLQNEYVRSHILSISQKDQRDLTIERYILLAKKLTDEGNFFSAKAIYLAIQDPDVRRLVAESSNSDEKETILTWKGLTESGLQTLNYLSTLYELAESTRSNLSKLIANHSGPQLPTLDRITVKFELAIKGTLENLGFTLMKYNELKTLANTIHELSIQPNKSPSDQQSLDESISEYQTIIRHHLSLDNMIAERAKETDTHKISLYDRKIAPLNALLMVDHATSANLIQLLDETIAATTKEIHTTRLEGQAEIEKSLKESYRDYTPHIQNTRISTALLDEIHHPNRRLYQIMKSVHFSLNNLQEPLSGSIARAKMANNQNKVGEILTNLKKSVLAIYNKVEAIQEARAITQPLLGFIEEYIHQYHERGMQDSFNLVNSINNLLAQIVNDIKIKHIDDYEKGLSTASLAYRSRQTPVNRSHVSIALPSLNTPSHLIHFSDIFKYMDTLRQFLHEHPHDETRTKKLAAMESIIQEVLALPNDKQCMADYLTIEIERNSDLQTHHTYIGLSGFSEHHDTSPITLLKQARENLLLNANDTMQSFHLQSEMILAKLCNKINMRELTKYHDALATRSDMISRNRCDTIHQLMTHLNTLNDNQAKLHYLNACMSNAEFMHRILKHHKNPNGTLRRTMHKKTRAQSILEKIREELTATVVLENEPAHLRILSRKFNPTHPQMIAALTELKKSLPTHLVYTVLNKGHHRHRYRSRRTNLTPANIDFLINSFFNPDSKKVLSDVLLRNAETMLDAIEMYAIQELHIRSRENEILPTASSSTADEMPPLTLSMPNENASVSPEHSPREERLERTRHSHSFAAFFTRLVGGRKGGEARGRSSVMMEIVDDTVKLKS